MFKIDLNSMRIAGVDGSLPISEADKEVFRRLSMLIDGECGESGPTKAARKSGVSKQRYYQVLDDYLRGGLAALKRKKSGPKKKTKLTESVVRQLIRHRFLDQDASVEVVVQKMRQSGVNVSAKSVNNVFVAYGLQKKTLRVRAER